MNGIKCVVFFAVLTFLQNLSNGDAEDAEVSCAFMKSCILPCSFDSTTDGLLIHWYDVSHGEENKESVHSYYFEQDQFAHQDHRYSNRTSLFQDQFSRGNASLLLIKVEVQDNGRYMCYISNFAQTAEKSYINLRVDAPVGEVNIEQVGNRIICSSERIYPEPEITWSTSPSSNVTFNTTVQKTDQQLYNISSSLVLSDSVSGLVYSCNVSTHSNWRRATLTHQQGQGRDSSVPNPDVKGIPGGVIAAIVCGIIAGLSFVGLVAYRIQKDNHHRPEARNRRGSGYLALQLRSNSAVLNCFRVNGGRDG